jgi:peroxiredoxin/mono/diheme cytochrome c family protein
MRSPRICSIVLAVLTGLSGHVIARADHQPTRQISDFELRDIWGKTYRLADFAEKPVVVVTFIGTECPLAKLYAPRLVELERQFADRGVAFIAIASNQQDSIAELQHYARTAEIKFPLLKDGDSRVADLFGAARTPQAFVLDQQRVVCYSGRIDDQYGYDRGVGYQRPQATTRDLADAIEAVLAGKEVEHPQTEVLGCLIGRPKTPDADSPVTYSNQIARIFQKRCVECHRPGEIGPFSLLSYEDAGGWGEMIREVVETERMPPWGASPKYGKFLNDPRLTDVEKQQIYDWVDHGCPEGDPSQLPPPRQFASGWQIDEPDQVFYMSDKPFLVPAEGTVEYQYFEVDPGWKEDVWIKGAEARPGNRGVVHHIIVFVKPPTAGENPFTRGSGVGPTDLLAGYAPGTPPLSSRHGTGRKIKAGSKLLFQMHYTPNGRATEDRSYLGLIYATPDEVTHDARSGFAAQLNLDIPPGADDYVARSKRTFRKETLLLSLMPHMHLRGKSFRYDLEYPDGKVETLLEVPRYDFNWQLVYVLEKPKLLPAGTTMRCEAHYDNSANNLANPDPSQRVRWGDQTWEEMMIGWFVSTELQPSDKERFGVAAPGGGQ